MRTTSQLYMFTHSSSRNITVSKRQCRYTVVQYVGLSFVIERILASFVNFDWLYWMIFRQKCTKLTVCGCFSLKNIQKLLVTDVFLYLGLLYALVSNFRLHAIFWYVHTVHFRSQADKVTVSQWACLTFEFTENALVLEEIERMARFKIARIQFSAMSASRSAFYIAT